MKKPVDEIADRLSAEVREDPSGAKSLAHLLVVVPTAQSGRRLRFKLAERLGAFVPPEIRLPPQLYMTDKELSQADRRQLFTHPVISFQILRDADFSQAIQLGVLQHHEKENGTGYPQHKTGDKISLYAKIIGVACTFEAITASRHYKESKNPYDAMMELLKNEGNQYDPAILKAMLYTYSLFPIGEYVYLQNGKVGQVIDVNPESPKNPIVEIPGEYDENGNLVRIQTNDTDIKIVRVLTRKEREDMLATLQTKRRPLPKRP